MDIPNNVLERVVESFSETGHAVNIRLVNKRLSVLALPIVLHTVSAKSIDALSHLVSVPLSPLYLERLGQHIHCFEIAFSITDYELMGIHHDIPLAVPNLDTMRFRFTSGVRTNTGENDIALLSEDTLCSAMKPAANGDWLNFLSQFKPKKFEWISNDSEDLHFVGMYTQLRLLFESWSSLTFIYLDGICLVEQPDLATWTPAFLAERIHIRGVSIVDSSFLAGLVNVRLSTPCRFLLLEAPDPEGGSLLVNRQTMAPIITCGAIMIALKGWDPANRQKFVDSLTHQPQSVPVQQLLSKVEPLEKTRLHKEHLPTHVGITKTFALRFLVGLVVGIIVSATVVDWHIHGLSRHSFFFYPMATWDKKACLGENLCFDEPSLHGSHGLRWSQLRRTCQPSKAHNSFLTFVPT